MTTELFWLWLAAGCYFALMAVALAALNGVPPNERVVMFLTLAGLVLHSVSIGLRWARLGHGPFITLFEVLSSNVWSLTLIFLISYRAVRAVRPTLVVVAPVLCTMLLWLLMISPAEGHLPPTYRTPLLYFHVALGKVFLGAVLVAVGVAGLILLRGASMAAHGRDFGAARGPRYRMLYAALPDNSRLEELAFRFMVLGFIFETAMLITGAIWAQDAWGRYWAWDPLETWSFITWLLLAGYLHSRITFRLDPRIGALMVIGVFVIAFLTFFGVPFISTAPHKGAV